jgi:hypothetical protein
MALQSSGQISIGDINVALGNAGTRTNRGSLGNTSVRELLGRPSGQVALSDAYGKSVAGSGVFVPGDRAAGRTKVLIISPDVDDYGASPRTQGIPNLTTRETAAGFTVDSILSYAAFEALTDEQLFQYMHIWDIGFYTSIPTGSRTQFIKYVTQGGAVWWSGENNSGAAFQAKNDSIVAVLNTLGAGTIVRDSFLSLTMQPATIEAEFRLANSATSTSFAAPSYFNAWGTGTPMCYKADNPGLVPVVVWKTGSLTNAPKGCCVAIMDINWADNAYIDANFVDNLVQVLNTK